MLADDPDDRDEAPARDLTLGYAMLEPYQTADGAWLCLGAGEARFARPLLDALQRTDLLDLALGKPGDTQNPLRDFLATSFRTRTLDDWLGWLQSHGIPAMPVLGYRDAMRHPHVEARGMLVTDTEGHRHLDTPIRFAREPGRPVLWVPTPGEHTELIAARRGDA